MPNADDPLPTHSLDGTQIRPIAEARNCMSCGLSFLSEGPWNRKCDKCNLKAGVYGRAASMNKLVLSNTVVQAITAAD